MDIRYHLVLTRGLSYRGYGITATKDSPDVYVYTDVLRDSLLASGYFEEVPGEKSSTSEFNFSDPDNGDEGKTLEEMNTSELETYATYNGISLKGIKKKADMIAKLREELGAAAEGKVTYGSPTMVELQEG